MTRYTVHEAWGGGEATLEHPDGPTIPMGYRFVRRDTGQVGIFPTGALTELPPPIPDEPEPGAYLIGSVMCVRPPANFDTEWFCFGKPRGWRPWADVWSNFAGPGVPIVRLVPESELLPDNISLPWKWRDKDGDEIWVDGSGVGVAAGSAAACVWHNDLPAAELYAALLAAKGHGK